ncbi:cytosolic enolase 3-like [Papaver somniferum]|uniref:cytosolic enolase 3-like n=1 Tax=Papaver somniferum TaxID=3469 RepID=UPI000E704ADB|nr:cytosolic enolase 3-like [Papaver somniferum]
MDLSDNMEQNKGTSFKDSILLLDFDLKELGSQMSVQEYLDKHLLSRKIEDVVNAAVRAKAPDPVLFISNHTRKAVCCVITKIKARQILDSKGVPTVEVDLYTNKGMFRVVAPSGTSSGIFLSTYANLTYEALELRDGDNGKYLGKGVSRAGQLGVNAILAVSIAACKAGAAEKEVPLYKHITDLSGKTNLVLPVPAFTVISGGKHAGNNFSIQEIMILPVGANSFEEAVQMGSETYHYLKIILIQSQSEQAIIIEKYGRNGCNVGEDGGFSPNISSFTEGLDLVKQEIDRAGYSERIKIAMDVAATDFCIGTKYDLDYKSPNKSGQNFKTAEDMAELYTELCKVYPIVSIEDPFDKDDWEHTKLFTSLGICQVAGDDLLMSNPKRTEKAIDEFTCNALVLKKDEELDESHVQQQSRHIVIQDPGK